MNVQSQCQEESFERGGRDCFNLTAGYGEISWFGRKLGEEKDKGKGVLPRSTLSDV